jgi:probable HAF family extracellular repeat protein
MPMPRERGEAMTDYSYTTTIDLNGIIRSPGSPPLAINDAGQVVGDYVDGTTVEVFIYSNGIMTTIDPGGPNYKTVLPGGTEVPAASEINDSGQVLAYTSFNGLGSFIYSNGTYTTLDPGYGAIAINNAGQVTESYYVAASNSEEGFIYSSGTYTTLDPLGSTPGTHNVQPLAINNAGQVIGYFSVGGSNSQEGFIYSNGTYTTLDLPGTASGNFVQPVAINSSGQVAGYYTNSADIFVGFVYSNGTYTTIDPQGSIGAQVVAINDLSQVVGNFYNGGVGAYEGFVYSNGIITTIDPPGSTISNDSTHQQTVITAINASGQVAGYYFNGVTYEGFVYSNGTYINIDPAGPTVATYISGINDSSQVVGSYTINNGDQVAFVASPDPTVVADTAHVSVAGTITADAVHGLLGKCGQWPGEQCR